MNMQELEVFLNANSIPKNMYSLSGGLPNEKYCIEKVQSGWHVYYSERGVKNEIGCYITEDEACQCMIKTIQKEMWFLK